jgi:hypothetical protein
MIKIKSLKSLKSLNLGKEVKGIDEIGRKRYYDSDINAK